MASTPTCPGSPASTSASPAGPTPSRVPACPASFSSQAPMVWASGRRRPSGRTGPEKATSRSTPKPRRSPPSPGTKRTPGAPPPPTTTTASGPLASSAATASAQAPRSAAVSTATRPETTGGSRGGDGQNATATVEPGTARVAGGTALTPSSVADATWDTAVRVEHAEPRRRDLAGPSVGDGDALRGDA